jgi:hypothetical protein
MGRHDRSANTALAARGFRLHPESVGLHTAAKQRPESAERYVPHGKSAHRDPYPFSPSDEQAGFDSQDAEYYGTIPEDRGGLVFAQDEYEDDQETTTTDESASTVGHELEEQQQQAARNGAEPAGLPKSKMGNGSASVESSDTFARALTLVKELMDVNGRMTKRQQRIASLQSEQDADQRYQSKLFSALGENMLTASIEQKGDTAMWRQAIDSVVQKLNGKWAARLAKAERHWEQEMLEQHYDMSELQRDFDEAALEIQKLRSDLDLQRTAMSAYITNDQDSAAAASRRVRLPQELDRDQLAFQRRASQLSREGPPSTRRSTSGGEPTTAANTPQRVVVRGGRVLPVSDYYQQQDFDIDAAVAAADELEAELEADSDAVDVREVGGDEEEVQSEETNDDVPVGGQYGGGEADSGADPNEGLIQQRLREQDVELRDARRRYRSNSGGKYERYDDTVGIEGYGDAAAEGEALTESTASSGENERQEGAAYADYDQYPESRDYNDQAGQGGVDEEEAAYLFGGGNEGGEEYAGEDDARRSNLYHRLRESYGLSESNNIDRPSSPAEPHSTPAGVSADFLRRYNEDREAFSMDAEEGLPASRHPAPSPSGDDSDANMDYRDFTEGQYAYEAENDAEKGGARNLAADEAAIDVDSQQQWRVVPGTKTRKVTVTERTHIVRQTVVEDTEWQAEEDERCQILTDGGLRTYFEYIEESCDEEETDADGFTFRTHRHTAGEEEYATAAAPNADDDTESEDESVPHRVQIGYKTHFTQREVTDVYDETDALDADGEPQPFARITRNVEEEDAEEQVEPGQTVVVTGDDGVEHELKPGGAPITFTTVEEVNEREDIDDEGIGHVKRTIHRVEKTEEESFSSTDEEPEEEEGGDVDEAAFESVDMIQPHPQPHRRSNTRVTRTKETNAEEEECRAYNGDALFDQEETWHSVEGYNDETESE